VRSKQVSRLEALRAHREDLHRRAEQARDAGDEMALALIELLLKKCDALAVKAERDSKTTDS
jgi:hypothetical protein